MSGGRDLAWLAASATYSLEFLVSRLVVRRATSGAVVRGVGAGFHDPLDRARRLLRLNAWVVLGCAVFCVAAFAANQRLQLGLWLPAAAGQLVYLAVLVIRLEGLVVRSAKSIPGPPPSVQQALAMNAAADHFRTFHHDGDLSALEKAIDSYREIVDGSAVGDPNRAMFLSHLSIALRFRSQQPTARHRDLDEATALAGESVKGANAAHPNGADHLDNVGWCLLARFDRTDDRSDLDGAVAAFRFAASVGPVNHPNRWGHLSDVSAALTKRHQLFHDDQDLAEALTFDREAKGHA